MLNKTIDIGDVKGLKLNDNLEYLMLQFTGDMMIMGEGSWQNLWSLKAVLRGFKLVFGLKIIIFQKKIILFESK